MRKESYVVTCQQAKYLLLAKQFDFNSMELNDKGEIEVYYFSPQWVGETDEPLTEERYRQQIK
jgi:hypothetical protein